MALQPGSSLLIAPINAGSTFATNNTSGDFWPLINCDIHTTNTSEALAQVKFRGASTLSKLGVNVISNARAGSSVFKIRKNGADGNLTVTVGAGATGYFEDASNTDSIADGDLVCASWTLAGGNGASLVISGIVCQQTMASGNAVQYLGLVSTGNFLYSGTGTTATYLPVCGDSQFNSSTSLADEYQPQVPCAGTFSSLQVYVTTNGRGTDSHVYLNVNGSDTALDITIGAGATGLFEDTTNSATIAQDDEVGYKVAPGSGAGTLTIRRFNVRFQGTADESPLMAGGTANAASGTQYGTFGSGSAANVLNSSETGTGLRVPFDCFAKDLYFYQSSASSTGTITLRVNGADSSLTKNWTGLPKHVNEHAIYTPIVATDFINMKVVFGATANARHFGVVLSNVDLDPSFDSNSNSGGFDSNSNSGGFDSNSNSGGFDSNSNSNGLNSNSASNDFPVFSIQQTKKGSGSFNDAIVTLDTAPVAGNLLIAFFSTFVGDPLNTSAWTAIDNYTATEPQFKAAYRWVQPGDTAALPELTTGNGGFWRAFVIEFENTLVGDADSNSIGDIIAAHSLRRDATGAGAVDVTDADPILTTETNQLVLGFFFDGNSATVPTATSGWTTLIREGNAGDVAGYMAIYVAYKYVSDAGDDPAWEVATTHGGGVQSCAIGNVVFYSGEGGGTPAVGARRGIIIVL